MKFKEAVICCEYPRLEEARTCRRFLKEKGIETKMNLFGTCLRDNLKEDRLHICITTKPMYKRGGRTREVPHHTVPKIKWWLKEKLGLVKEVTGGIDMEENLIIISKFSSHAFPTLVHELLHLERKEKCKTAGEIWEVCIGKRQGLKNVICPECGKVLKDVLDNHFEKRE